MEETTSWKAHGFTFFIFGGIVVLCSIFFALGMLVGRGQGRRIAEVALSEEAAAAAGAAGSEEHTFNFFSETTRESLESPPEPSRVEPPPPPPPPPTRRAEPAAAAPAPPPSASMKYLQILATPNRKQADVMLDKVKSSGFQAMITPRRDKDVEWFRVWVGPYSEKEIDLAKSDLEAKGFKDAFIAK